MSDIAKVILTGRLTANPAPIQGGVRLRVASSRSQKIDGAWKDVPGYYTVLAFAGIAESCMKFLTKGSQIVVDGALTWSEYQPDGGDKREQVSIVARQIQFVGGRPEEGKAQTTTSNQSDDFPF